MQEFIKTLEKHRYYKIFLMEKKPVIVFDDHRFVVPVLWLAHQHGIIDQTIDMVRFDGHLDNLDFNPNIKEDFAKLKNFDEAFLFAEEKLKKEDDDWLAFSLDQKLCDRVVNIYEGHDQPNPRYAQKMIQFKGWSRIPDGSGLFEVIEEEGPLLLDIDCDYFTFKWRGSIQPWNDVFYQKEFSGPSRGLAEQIIARAPFVTICLEPDFCGGVENARGILRNLSKFLFNESMK